MNIGILFLFKIRGRGEDWMITLFIEGIPIADARNSSIKVKALKLAIFIMLLELGA